jgi:hypothetical protein
VLRGRSEGRCELLGGFALVRRVLDARYAATKAPRDRVEALLSLHADDCAREFFLGGVSFFADLLAVGPLNGLWPVPIEQRLNLAFEFLSGVDALDGKGYNAAADLNSCSMVFHEP